MTDRRRFPANDRVASVRLRHEVDVPNYAKGTCQRVAVPVADLLRAPDGGRDRQLVFGELVLVYETHKGWAFVEAGRDGYVGYLRAELLRDPVGATHRVKARSTHSYSAPDFKAPELCALSFGSRVDVISDLGRFSETSDGYIPSVHLEEFAMIYPDPVDVAEVFWGTSYLWGGNSGFGIDCSGLIQAACLACGVPCPGDSDMQEAELGHHLPDDAPLKRGDLLFWKGHVAWVAGPDTLLHANAFHMATAYEPLQDAITRIERQGDGPVTARKRLGEIT